MSKYVRTQDNIDSKIKDEIVMVNVKQGNYYALNPVATRIWEIIESPSTIAEITDTLLSEYEIDRSTCETEVRTFISTLLKLDVIKEIS